MKQGRYLVYRGQAVRAVFGLESRPIAGIYARGQEGAEKLASELFEGPVTVEPYKLKSGWTDNGGLYLTKGSKHGLRYICKCCGKENLGVGAYNHWAWCPYDRRSQG